PSVSYGVHGRDPAAACNRAVTRAQAFGKERDAARDSLASRVTAGRRSDRIDSPLAFDLRNRKHGTPTELEPGCATRSSTGRATQRCVVARKPIAWNMAADPA